jgi:hypothetical protein
MVVDLDVIIENMVVSGLPPNGYGNWLWLVAPINLFDCYKS